MTTETLLRALQAVAPVRVDEPLARHTTLGVGGPADYFVTLTTPDALAQTLTVAARHGLPWFLLGAGSNLLVGDGGIRGLVIEYDARAVSGPLPGAAGTVRFQVEAGASLATVARRLSRAGYTGLEWAIGIPGTLGGAMVTNAGAYGLSLADNLAGVTVVRATGEVALLPPAAFALAYRESALSRGQMPGTAVAAIELAVRPGDPAAIAALVAAHDQHREAAQPKGRNTGSVFKNPPGRAAWQLIDAAGLRGLRCGGAQITEKHTNFFANTGHARAAEVKALMDLAVDRVQARFGVTLEPEVWLMGEGFSLPPAEQAALRRAADARAGGAPASGAAADISAPGPPLAGASAGESR